MLTRDVYGCDQSRPPPTQVEEDEAMKRLQTGFSFVGLTEQWDLSICLFNKMFNQECQSIQFDNTRPTSTKNSTDYDTVVLNNWRDLSDGKLYDAATKMFEENLEKYGASEISCEPCWRQAGIL